MRILALNVRPQKASGFEFGLHAGARETSSEDASCRVGRDEMACRDSVNTCNCCRENYWYSASMRRAPDSSKATSKDLAFLMRISPNCFSWTQGDGLELDHFEHGEEGDDHGVTGGAGFEELDEADGVGVAGEDLAAELGDHLGNGEGFVLQLDAGDFFFALEDLLEDADEIDEGDDQFAFGAFVVVERFVGLGPDVFFDLLFLVEKLRGVFEFFVLDEALDEFFARIGGLLFGGGERVGREKHFRFDVDERGGHVDEFGGDVDVLDFELVEVVEVLRGDFGDLDVVDVHFLLFDEIEQEVEGTFVDRDVDAVRSGHCRGIVYSEYCVCGRVGESSRRRSHPIGGVEDASKKRRSGEWHSNRVAKRSATVRRACGASRRWIRGLGASSALQTRGLCAIHRRGFPTRAWDSARSSGGVRGSGRST